MKKQLSELIGQAGFTRKQERVLGECFAKVLDAEPKAKAKAKAKAKK